MNRINNNSVQELINKTLAVYQADAARVIADYRAEKQYTADYEGRQILELLQNADDAETDSILIDLDTNQNTLSISNKGIPFSLSGVKSLMLANMSPKNKKEYIGNKGLGFRSILNWVTQVKVITENTVLEFSPNWAKSQFEVLKKLNPDLLIEVSKDENLVRNEIPFAVLAIPEIKEKDQNSKWVTTIKLYYKPNEEESIKAQLAAIKEETLLFLKHTNEIIISSDFEEARKYIKSVLPENKIQVNDKVWNVYHSGEQQYSEEKMYHFQIAWQDDLSDKEGVFYTYFPTEMPTYLPCLIHATFDLNASRKEINQSEENKFILKEIAKVLGEIAAISFEKEVSSWKPYQFLFTTSSSFSKVLTDFYQSINTIRKSLAIYPSTDGAYYHKEEIYDYGLSFSSWVENNDLSTFFFKLIKPIPDEYDINLNGIYLTQKYTPEELLKIVEDLNLQLTSFTSRAELVRFLLDHKFKNLHESNIRLPLLIERETALPTNDQIFTILKEDNTSILPPDFVKGMSFIDTSFYRELTQVLSEEIQKIRRENENISRPLKRVVESVVNIGSNDIIDVIRYVLKETENQLEQPNANQEFLIKSLVDFLFEIYSKNSERRGALPLSIPLLNRSKTVVLAEDLFLGHEYKAGELTEFLFSGIYSHSDYIISNNYWQLNFETEEEIAPFFTWLGVNRFLKYQKELKEINPTVKYQNFVFKNRPDLLRSVNLFKGLKIADESIIKKLSIEKLLILLSKDSILKRQLSENHTDSYRYNYGNGHPKVLHSFPSFIDFQISTSIDLSNYIINNELGVDQLFKTIDFSNEPFTFTKVIESEINSVLERFGSIKSLDDISLEQFYLLFKNQVNLFINGKGGSQFYKRFLEFCTKNKEISNAENHFDFSNFLCYARKGGRKENSIELVNVSEVYYSDNKLVPKDILDRFWILYLPSRLGERNVKKYFGVKLISDVIETLSIETLETSLYNSEFITHIQKLKPYFLYYRLSNIKDKGVKNEAINLTKNIDIKLVSDCTYKFENGEKFELKENNFIKVGEAFFVKNNNNLDSLVNDIKFCDTIAEIFGTHYKVKELHSSFRSILNTSIKNTEYIIESNNGEDELLEAKKLLGISSNESTFWKNLFKVKNTIIDTIESTEELAKQLNQNLHYELPEDYHLIDFNNLSKKETFNFVCVIENRFDLKAKDIITWQTNGFTDHYIDELIDCTNNYKDQFLHQLWIKLDNSNSIAVQEKFISLVFTYNSFKDENKVIEAIKRNYLNTSFNINQFLIDQVENQFNLEELNQLTETIKPTKLYSNLLSEYGIEEDEIPEEKKSLFYFEGHEAVLREFLVGVSEKVKDQTQENEEVNDVGKLHSGSSVKKPVTISTGIGNTGWSHGNKDIQRKKRAGIRAEKLVYNTLVKEHGADNVKWMSSFSETTIDKADSHHFDIAYKVNESWKFVEVKSFNGSYFHLTREEKAYGMKNSNRYEIALVQGQEIYLFNELFKEGVDFDDNSFFTATPSDYIISLTINKKNN